MTTRKAVARPKLRSLPWDKRALAVTCPNCDGDLVCDQCGVFVGLDVGVEAPDAIARPKSRPLSVDVHALQAKHCRALAIAGLVLALDGDAQSVVPLVERITYQHEPETVTSC